MTDRRQGGMGRGVAGLTVVRLIGMAAGLLVTVVGARALGTDGVGIVGVAQTLAILIGLIANAGITMAIIYFVGRAVDQRAVAGSLMALALLTAALAAAGTAAVVWLVGDAVSLPPELILPTAALAAVAVCVEAFGAVLLARNLVREYIGADLLRSVALLLFTVIGLSLVASPGTMVLAAAGAVSVAAAVIAILVWRSMPGLRLRIHREDWRAALGFGLRGQVGNVLQFVTLRFDTLLVAALAGPGPTGLYVVAAKIAEATTQVANAGATLLFPDVARNAELSRSRTMRLLRQTGLVVVVGGVAIGVLAVPALPLVFGPEFASATTALWVLLVAAVPLSIGRVLAGHIKGRGRPGLVSIAASFGLTVTIVGDIVLIPAHGIVGAALVSVFAYSVTTIILAWQYRRLGADDVSARAATGARPRVATLAFQGYGNVGDEAILCGLESIIGDSVEPSAVFAGPLDVAAFQGVPRIRTWKLLPTLRGFRVLRRVDTLLMSGGGLVNDHWWPLIPRLLLWTLAARLAGCRVVWAGSGVGPIRRLPWRCLAGLMFRLAHEVIVRDASSRSWVARCPLAPTARLGADPALFLDRPAAVASRRGLGLIGRMPVPADPAQADALAAAFVRLAAAEASAGSTAVLLSLDPPADAPFLARVEVVAASLGLPPLACELMPPSPQTVMEQLAGLDRIVTVRLHGLVLAALASVPAVPVVYDPKVAAASDALGLADVAIPVAEVSAEAVGRAMEIVGSPSRREVVEARLTALREQRAELRTAILDALA